MTPRTFTICAQPSEKSSAITLAFTCERCKLTNAGSLPSKASYSAADIEAIAKLVARVAGRPCGCAL